MAEKAVIKADVQIERCRVAFVHLAEPHKFSDEDGDDKLRFSLTAIINPDTKEGKKALKEIELVKKLLETDAFKKHPMRYKEDRCCFFEGDSKTSQKTGEVPDGYEGMMCVTAKNKRRVPVVDRKRNTLVPDDSGFPYGGCYCNVLVRFYTTTKGGGPGFFASLEAVQFVEDGEPFGAAPADPNKVFKNLDSEGGDDDEKDDGYDLI
jgi:hypothetical protein